MESINPQVNNLFHTYTLMTGFEMGLSMASERWLTDCINDGITPEDLGMAINGRRLWNLTHECKKSLLLHKMVRDPEDRAILINEIAEIKARKRIKVMEPAKASVLRQTGRSTDPPQKDAEQAKEALKRGMDEMRKALEQ